MAGVLINSQRMVKLVNVEEHARTRLIWLETLSGSRTGPFSIRINDQYRICFIWKAKGPTDVEITDYH